MRGPFNIWVRPSKFVTLWSTLNRPIPTFFVSQKHLRNRSSSPPSLSRTLALKEAKLGTTKKELGQTTLGSPLLRGVCYAWERASIHFPFSFALIPSLVVQRLRQAHHSSSCPCDSFHASLYQNNLSVSTLCELMDVDMTSMQANVKTNFPSLLHVSLRTWIWLPCKPMSKQTFNLYSM